MPQPRKVFVIAIFVAAGLRVTGCDSDSGTAAPAFSPAPMSAAGSDIRTAATADCREASAPWSGLKSFATATPDDIRRCMAVEVIDRRDFPRKAASPFFPDDENALGMCAILATGIDPDDGARRRIMPLAFWPHAGWIARPWPNARTPKADETVVRALLTADADPNPVFAPGRGVTAHPILQLLKASRRNDPSAIPFDVTSKRHDQVWRVLHAAIGSNRPTGPIAALLKHGADPHVVTAGRKWTALHALAEGGASPGAAESGQLLLDAGIAPTLRDRKRQTAWDLARKRLTPRQLAAAPSEVRMVLARLQKTMKW